MVFALDALGGSVSAAKVAHPKVLSGISVRPVRKNTATNASHSISPTVNIQHVIYLNVGRSIARVVLTRNVKKSIGQGGAVGQAFAPKSVMMMRTRIGNIKSTPVAVARSLNVSNV
mmetsp:Transcript_15568/g.33723  ORF Transcript_15568/g.33723 Transcript_15568/m.33723 type:complete len:116 (-) Transcript_15568:1285-1632(-)